MKNCTCRNRELTTWSVVSVIAELVFGTIFLRISALQHLYATSREKLINGSLHRTPTRQICKPVNRKLYLSWISSFSIVILIFLPCLNKDLIHSFIQSIRVPKSHLFCKLHHFVFWSILKPKPNAPCSHIFPGCRIRCMYLVPALICSLDCLN